MWYVYESGWSKCVNVTQMLEMQICNLKLVDFTEGGERGRGWEAAKMKYNYNREKNERKFTKEHTY